MKHPESQARVDLHIYKDLVATTERLLGSENHISSPKDEQEFIANLNSLFSGTELVMIEQKAREQVDGLRDKLRNLDTIRFRIDSIKQRVMSCLHREAKYIAPEEQRASLNKQISVLYALARVSMHALVLQPAKDETDWDSYGDDPQLHEGDEWKS